MTTPSSIEHGVVYPYWSVDVSRCSMILIFYHNNSYHAQWLACREQTYFHDTAEGKECDGRSHNDSKSLTQRTDSDVRTKQEIQSGSDVRATTIQALSSREFMRTSSEGEFARGGILINVRARLELQPILNPTSLCIEQSSQQRCSYQTSSC